MFRLNAVQVSAQDPNYVKMNRPHVLFLVSLVQILRVVLVTVLVESLATACAHYNSGKELELYVY